MSHGVTLVYCFQIHFFYRVRSSYAHARLTNYVHCLLTWTVLHPRRQDVHMIRLSKLTLQSQSAFGTTAQSRSFLSLSDLLSWNLGGFVHQMQALSRTLRRSAQLNARFAGAACPVTTSAASEASTASSVAPTRKDALSREFQVNQLVLTGIHLCPHARTCVWRLPSLLEVCFCLLPSRSSCCFEPGFELRLIGCFCRYIVGTQTVRINPSIRVTMLTSTGQCGHRQYAVSCSTACSHS